MIQLCRIGKIANNALKDVCVNSFTPNKTLIQLYVRPTAVHLVRLLDNKLSSAFLLSELIESNIKALDCNICNNALGKIGFLIN